MTARNYEEWVSGRFEYNLMPGVKLVADEKKGAYVVTETGDKVSLEGYTFNTYPEMIDFVYTNITFYFEDGRYQMTFF